MTLTQVNTPGEPRYYLLGGKTRLESVTEVLSGGMPQPHLLDWAARRERALVLDSAYQEMVARPRHPTQVMRDLRARLSTTPLAHGTERDGAASIGTQAHALMEMWLKGESYDELLDSADPEAYNAFQAGIGWCMSVGLEAKAIESRVYSLDLGVAGTMDLVTASLSLPALEPLYGKRRITCILDWKTSRFLSLSHVIQGCVYRHCFLEHNPDANPLPVVVVRLPKRKGDQVDAYVTQAEDAPKFVEVFRACKLICDVRRAWDREHPLLTAQKAV